MSGSCESWGLNSTHIHGTHVPVEEPSTASRAAIRKCNEICQEIQLLDHLVGAGEEHWRRIKADFGRNWG